MRYRKIILFILLILLFSSCSSIESRKEKLDYRIYKVENNNKKLYHGYVKAQHLIELGFQTEGRINYLPYTIGDFVKKGQVIAKLDGILYEIQKQEEVARLNEARIRENKYNSYYKRVDILHNAGAISDNDWEDAYFNLKTATQDISIQRQKINYIDKQINYTQLIAPYDGYIYEKKADVGTMVNVGQVVYSMISSKQTEVDTMVDSSIINSLKEGEVVDVYRNNDKLKGTIAHISKSSLQSGGYLIRIYLDKLYPELKEGMSIDVEFKNNTNSILIPVDFVLLDSNNQEYVYRIIRVKDNIAKIEKQAIKTKNLYNNLIEVSNGIAQGDELIVISNSSKDYNGEKIKL